MHRYQQSLLKQFIQTVWGWGWWWRGGPNARWSSKCTRTPTTTCQSGPAPLTLTTQPQRRLTFHNHGSPHAKTSHITYVGTASLMTGASGAGEGEARANWCFSASGRGRSLDCRPCGLPGSRSCAVHIVTVSMAALGLISPSAPTSCPLGVRRAHR